MAEMLKGVTRKGWALCDGISQADYDAMMHSWTNRFPSGLSGTELEERFRSGGISADLHNTPITLREGR